MTKSAAESRTLPSTTYAISARHCPLARHTLLRSSSLLRESLSIHFPRTRGASSPNPQPTYTIPVLRARDSLPSLVTRERLILTAGDWINHVGPTVLDGTFGIGRYLACNATRNAINVDRGREASLCIHGAKPVNRLYFGRRSGQTQASIHRHGCRIRRDI